MDVSQRLNNSEEEIELFGDLDETPELVQKRRSQGRIIFDRFIRHRAAIIGVIFLTALFLLCFLGPMFWKFDPDLIPNDVITSRFTPPVLAHPFGTDWVGRD